jgi:site-specific recombinase XerD
MVLVNFQVWLHKSILEANRQDIITYLAYLLNDRHIAKNSAQTYFIAIRAFYTWAVNQKLILEDPSKGIDMIRPPKRLPVWLTISEMSAMYRAASGHRRDLMLLKMLYSTGVRVTESINIRKRDIDSESGIIKIFGKGSKERIVVIHEAFRRDFAEYIQGLEENDKLFPLCQGSVQKIIRKIARKAGVKKHVTPHKLRHSFATHLLQNGVSIVFIQRLLGHASLNTTQIYVHCSDQELVQKESLLPVGKIFVEAPL